MLIIVGLTAMVGLLYGEGEVKPASSSPPALLFKQAADTLPSAGPTDLCALSGWKQFLQEPGFHTCSAKSPHADIFGLLRCGSVRGGREGIRWMDGERSWLAHKNIKKEERSTLLKDRKNLFYYTLTPKCPFGLTFKVMKGIG